MEGGKVRLYSADDAINTRAYEELLFSIAAIPTKSQSLPKRQQKGRVYLVKFHEELSDCYITRMPKNILRLIVTYNPLMELCNLGLSCKGMSELLVDKYLVQNFPHSGDFYRGSPFSNRDIRDICRIEELTREAKRIKCFPSLRPETAQIFHINTEKCICYSLFRGKIIEANLVRYNDSIEIRDSRDGIEDIVAVDAHAETVICASHIELAVSNPDVPLRTTRFLSTDSTIAIKFVGNYLQIAVLKLSSIAVFSQSLITLQKIAFASSPMSGLFIKNRMKAAFAAADVNATVCCFLMKEGKLSEVHRMERKGYGHVKDVLMHHYESSRSKRDFLIVLYEDGVLAINSKTFSEYSAIQLQENTLIATGPTGITLYSFNEPKCIFHRTSSISFHPSISNSVCNYIWKVKAAFLTRSSVFWCRKTESNNIIPIAECPILEFSSASLISFGNFLLVKGVIPVTVSRPKSDAQVDVPMAVVLNFAGNSYGETDWEEVKHLAQRIGEEMYEKRMEEERKSSEPSRKSRAK